MTETKIALTNLGKYNEGELIFTWVELPATQDKSSPRTAQASTDLSGLLLLKFPRFQGNRINSKCYVSMSLQYQSFYDTVLQI